ncbi:MAG: D-alanine--D-alanine ligase [Bdellovibrionales bacterium]|nr:D-alanine--D-alanine ligase [Bdellovibrionales bacterium]
MIHKKTKIAILYGGLSREREVSLKTGKAIYEALTKKEYLQAQLVDVDHDIASKLRDGAFECAYIALHGRYGEDGCIQGLLECMKIPYTGVGVFPSALAMNKAFTKVVLGALGLRVSPSFVSSEDMDYSEFEKRLLEKVSLPFVGKPVHEGSTFGLQIVRRFEELKESFERVHQFDRQALWEPFISGREFTVAVVDAEAFPVIEIKPLSGLYDYEAKYEPGKTEFICPAALSQEQTLHIQSEALRAAQILGVDAFSRVDFMFDGVDFWILEVNTMPGMTGTSLVPRAAKAKGIDFEDLVEHLLLSAGLGDG